MENDFSSAPHDKCLLAIWDSILKRNWERCDGKNSMYKLFFKVPTIKIHCGTSAGHLKLVQHQKGFV